MSFLTSRRTTYLAVFISFLTTQACRPTPELNRDFGFSEEEVNELLEGAEGTYLVNFEIEAFSGPEVGSVIATAKLDRPAEEPLSIGFNLSGDALLGSDFGLSSSQFNFEVGDEYQNVFIYITNDDAVESTEQLILQLLPSSNVLVGSQDSFTLTIQDNDMDGIFAEFTTLPKTVYERAEDQILIEGTLSEARSTPTNLTVTLGGSAGLNSDYTGPTNSNNVSLVVPANQVDFSFSIQTVDDFLSEGSETVLMTLSSNTTGVSIGNKNSLEVTILDDESLPAIVVSFDSNSLVVNAQETQGEEVLGVTLASPAPIDLVVRLNVINAQDFIPEGQSGTPDVQGLFLQNYFTIPQGETSGSLTFQIIDDCAQQGGDLDGAPVDDFFVTIAGTFSNIASAETLDNQLGGVGSGAAISTVSIRNNNACSSP